MSSETNELTSSELAVLESLHGATESVSQRELARRAGISVGLVNAVLKRLVHTGYVKTSRLDRRSIEYLLTADGFAHAALRSYRYIVNTFRGYRDMQSRLCALVGRLKTEGVTEFYLSGSGELADLVTLFFEEENLGVIKRGTPPAGLYKQSSVAILNTETKPLRAKGARIVELLREFNNGSATIKEKSETQIVPKNIDNKTQGSASQKGSDHHFERIKEFYGSRNKTVVELQSSKKDDV